MSSEIVIYVQLPVSRAISRFRVPIGVWVEIQALRPKVHGLAMSDVVRIPRRRVSVKCPEAKTLELTITSEVT